MQFNKVARNTTTTHEKGPAQPTLKAYDGLQRNVATCLLQEPTFYESGDEIVERIAALSDEVSLLHLRSLAVTARKKWNLRHVPLYLLTRMVRNNARFEPSAGMYIGDAIYDVISRPDEIPELIAMYWKDGKQPLTKQMKLGLGRAFNKFDGYQLAKWKEADKAISLRDALFMVHAKPKDAAQAALFKQLVDRTLPIPYTWETELSSGKDKAMAFRGLIATKKLPHMAAVMNARNMVDAGISPEHVGKYIIESAAKSKLFPYRYWTAAKNAPEVADALERAALQAVQNMLVIPGRTALLLDVSNSMRGTLSSKSQATRWEAAAALGMLIRSRAESCIVARWAGDGEVVPNVGGFGIFPFVNPTNHGRYGIPGGTYLTKSLKTLAPKLVGVDRIIIITDEQSADGVPQRIGPPGYIVNVAPYKHGIGVEKGWVKIDGWSERVIDYILETERLDKQASKL